MKKVLLGLCAATVLGLGAGDARATELDELPPEVVGLFFELLNVPGEEEVQSITLNVQRRGSSEPRVYKYVASLAASDSLDCMNRPGPHIENKGIYKFVWCKESNDRAQRDTYAGARLIASERQDNIECTVDPTLVKIILWPRLSQGAFDKIC